jgi:hypothetical protein
MRGVSFTQGTRGLVGEALEGFGFVGSVALGREGLGLGGWGRSRHSAFGPGEVHEDEKPHECEQDQLGEKKMRYHGANPSKTSCKRGILPGFGGHGIIRRLQVHDRQAGFEFFDYTGCLEPGQYLIHDRDTKSCAAFKQLLDDAGVNRVLLSPRSPYLNAFAERFVRSVKVAAMSRMILFGERSLWHVLNEYVAHYHEERPHQGKGNVILFPSAPLDKSRKGSIRYRERLGGLLKSYDREAAWVF